MITGIVTGDVVGEEMAGPKLGLVAGLRGEEWRWVLWTVFW